MIMIIAIKSEMDSRPLLYPLLRALHKHGSICLLSSNRIVSRLIEDDDNGGFRNIRVIVDEDGATDTVYQEYGINQNDFDFIILDNMGSVEYDLLLVPVGLVTTEEFQADIDLLKREANSRFIQFGKGGKSRKASKPTKPIKSNNQRRGKHEESEEDDDNPADQFKVEISLDEEFKVGERWYNCSYPTWEDIEKMEALYKFPIPSAELITALYDIFKIQIGLDKRTFEKEMKIEDKITGKAASVNTDI